MYVREVCAKAKHKASFYFNENSWTISYKIFMYKPT